MKINRFFEQILHLYPIKISFFLILLSCHTSSDINKELSLPIPKDNNVKIRTLKNGLTYYIRKNKMPEKSAELRLVIKAGSILENSNERGVAHFIEHMAFKRTKHYKSNELIKFLESLGMSHGPEINAFTGFDNTIFHLTINTDKAEIIDKSMQILHDWAFNIIFDPHDVEKEKKIILEEWRIYQGVHNRLRQKFASTIFSDSLYANRQPIGTPESIKSINIEKLTSFYEKYYCPQNMAIIAVGDFVQADLEKTILKYFDNSNGLKKCRPIFNEEINIKKSQQYSTFTDQEVSFANIELYYQYKHEQGMTLRDFKHNIIQNLCHVIINDRFVDLSLKPGSKFLQTGFGIFNISKNVKSHYYKVILKNTALENGLTDILKEIERIKRFGFTQDEFKRAKQRILSESNSLLYESNNLNSLFFTEHLVNHFLYDTAMPSLKSANVLHHIYIPKIRLNELSVYMDNCLKDSNRILLISAPEKDFGSIPQEDKINDIQKKISLIELEPYQETFRQTPLMDFVPKRSKVIKENYREKIGVYEWELENNIRVILKPTKLQKNVLLFSCVSPGGISLIENEDYLTAKFAADIVAQSGVAQFDLKSLNKILSVQNVKVQPFILELIEGMEGSSTFDSANLLFPLIYLYFTDIRVDKDSFLLYKNKIQTVMESKNSNLQAFFWENVSKYIYNPHVRNKSIHIDQLKEIEYEKAVSIYEKRFHNPADFIFFFVGSFTPKQIKPFIENYLGGLKTYDYDESWNDVGISFQNGIIEKNIYKGFENKSIVGLFLYGKYNWSLSNNYIFDSLTHILNIRLRNIIREKEAGSYFINAYLDKFRVPDECFIMNIFFECQPIRSEELAALVKGILKDLTKNIKQSEVDTVKEIQKKQYEQNIQNNDFWLKQLEYYYLHSQLPERILEYEIYNNQLNIQRLQQAAKQLFSMENYLKIILYPENNE